MSLSVISPKNTAKENEILQHIYDSIDSNESIIFNSGAGSGKTYALIKSLKYIIKNFERKLKEHNQKVICITYTNVATREVIERLGNSELVKVSTIHERIWELIKNYKKELVQIHKNRIVDEIAQLNSEVEEDQKYQTYRNLNEIQQTDFRMIMLEPNKKELFYENYNERSKEFKACFEDDMSGFPNMLKNVENFKRIVSTIYKLENYTKCLSGIELKEKGFTTVKYDATFNSDRLHWMRISHDTLLDYGLKIIQKYDLLKQIIIDQYPYIFIDEYQDTNEKVVQIVKQLFDHATKIKHSFFVGYFGDSAQNIYDEGVGKNIDVIHPNLKHINKEFNRRSTKEIINVINNIRNDDIKQKSIFEDCEGGSVKFYIGKKEDIKQFLEKYIDKWNIKLNNSLHCLVLTNKTVAEFSGFSNFYDCFSNTEKYSGINYQQLNTELLSDDLTKLGEIPVLFFKIINLRDKLKNPKTAVKEIINESIYEGMNILELRELIEILNRADGKSFSEYIKSISNIYSESSNLNYKKFVSMLFDLEKFSYEKFEENLISKLYPNLNEKKVHEACENINNLLNIGLSEYELWHHFILNKQCGEIIYHTYHGTKGLEFDNVILIMENAFGRSRNFFNTFFEHMTNDQYDDRSKPHIEQVRNLLYVSCSRAIKNLRVLYLDDVTQFSAGIEVIFGKVHQNPTLQ